MVRKTFGPSGQPIIIATSEDSGTIRITEYEPVSGNADNGNGGMEISGSEDSGDTGIGGVDFEPVGDVIRTEPIAGTGTESGFADPAAVSGKRPRKPRGPNKPKNTESESVRVVSVQLEKVLFSLHTMAAATLNEPELAIEEDEAKILAEAVEKVAKAYDFQAMLSPKTQASVDLCIALVTVYGRRVMTIARRPTKSVRNVTPINQAAQ